MISILLLPALLALFTSCSLVNQDLPNQPPKLLLSQADTTRVGRGRTVSLRVRATDEDDDPLSYNWTSFGEGSFRDSTSANTEWIAPDQINGSSEFFLLTLTISDHQPETEDPSQTFLIEVVQRPPTVALTADTTFAFSTPFAELEALGADPENDALEYQWEQLEGPTAVEVQDERLDNEHSRMRFIPTLPGNYRFAAHVGDGADTANAQVVVHVPAPPELPLVATVPRELTRPDGTRHTYQIDAYEYPNQRDQPPTLVSSFFSAVDFCALQGKRLCLAEEWRGACQGTELRRYSSSDDPAALAAFGLRFCNTAGSRVAGDAPDADFLTLYLAPAGTFTNCGTEGVYDLTGNAAEWVWVDSTLRAGTYTQNSVVSLRECGEFAEPLPALPVDFDFSSQAANNLGADYQGYFRGNMGFRCCRQ